MCYLEKYILQANARTKKKTPVKLNCKLKSLYFDDIKMLHYLSTTGKSNNALTISANPLPRPRPWRIKNWPRLVTPVKS